MSSYFSSLAPIPDTTSYVKSLFAEAERSLKDLESSFSDETGQVETSIREARDEIEREREEERRRHAGKMRELDERLAVAEGKNKESREALLRRKREMMQPAFKETKKLCEKIAEELDVDSMLGYGATRISTAVPPSPTTTATTTTIRTLHSTPVKRVRSEPAPSTPATTPTTTTTNTSPQPPPNSLDAKILDLFKNGPGTGIKRKRTLQEIYHRHASEPLSSSQTVPMQERKTLMGRKAKCRLCDVAVNTPFYAGTMHEEEGEVCWTHRFCADCGRFVTSRFEGRCPGALWGACNGASSRGKRGAEE